MALTVSVDEIVQGSGNPLLSIRPLWKRVRLREVATVLNGFAFKSSRFTKADGTPLIRIRDVGSDSTDTNYVGEFEDRYLVAPGDLLIGMDGDFNCARWRGPLGLLNQRVCKVTLTVDHYHPRFLDYALPGYLKAINDATSSVTVKHLSSRTVEDIPLPFPSAGEQAEIVAEIEKQFSRLDEAVANLQRVKANLKRYKAAVLKAALEGGLVPTEAELAGHAGRAFDAGADLLARALQQRRSIWRGRGKYKEPPPLAQQPSANLPVGWAWATVEQLTSLVTSGSRGWSEFYSPEGFLFIRAQDIKTDSLALNEVARVSVPADAEGTRSSVGIGDLLVTITGANVTKAARVNVLREKAFVSQHVALLKFTLPELSPFAFHWIVSPANGRKTLEKWAYGAGKPGLSLEQVRALPIAVPPLAEQDRIVAEVDRRLSIVREVDTEVDVNLKRAQALRQAVLAAAFRPSGRPLPLPA